MEFAVGKYGVDMVVGNLLGNKGWVKVRYNEQRFGEKREVEYEGEVEGSILKEVGRAYGELFGETKEKEDMEITE